MYSPNKLATLRRSTDTALKQANQLITRGDYGKAEQLCQNALNEWRRSSAPKDEENKLVCALGKCLEAQYKYEQAYELYMASLPNLKGEAYDDVYTSLLYLSERMGTFRAKEEDRLW